jgi:hypothetical protein
MALSASVSASSSRRASLSRPARPAGLASARPLGQLRARPLRRVQRLAPDALALPDQDWADDARTALQQLLSAVQTALQTAVQSFQEHSHAAVASARA